MCAHVPCCVCVVRREPVGVSSPLLPCKAWDWSLGVRLGDKQVFTHWIISLALILFSFHVCTLMPWLACGSHRSNSKNWSSTLLRWSLLFFLPLHCTLYANVSLKLPGISSTSVSFLTVLVLGLQKYTTTRLAFILYVYLFMCVHL